jgi:hypothetical protein
MGQKACCKNNEKDRWAATTVWAETEEWIGKWFWILWAAEMDGFKWIWMISNQSCKPYKIWELELWFKFGSRPMGQKACCENNEKNRWAAITVWAEIEEWIGKWFWILWAAEMDGFKWIWMISNQSCKPSQIWELELWFKAWLLFKLFDFQFSWFESLNQIPNSTLKIFQTRFWCPFWHQSWTWLRKRFMHAMQPSKFGLNALSWQIFEIWNLGCDT